MSDVARRGPPWPVLGWGVGAAFFFYAWVLRVSPSVMVEELMAEFAVGAAVLGQLSAWYFYGYAGMQIPVGMLLDRFGPRRLITAATGVCAIGCLLFVTGGLATASLGRFLIGAGSAFSLVGAMAVAGQWFEPRRFALLSGLAMMLGMAGGVFGQAPVRWMVEATSWRQSILIIAVGALGLMGAAWWLVRDRHRGGGDLRAVVTGLGTVARNRQMWLNAVAGLGATGPLLGFAALWGVPFLEARFEVERAQAAAMTSLVFVGLGLGAPLFGWLSDRLGRRRAPYVVGLALSLAAYVTVVYAPGLSVTVASALCVAVGLGSSAQIVGFAFAREMNPPGVSSTAIGFVNAMVTGAGALFQPVVGWVLDARWDGAVVDGVRVYALGDYRSGLGAIAVGTAIGLVCTLGLRETFCRPFGASDNDEKA